jgi:hypothetical protein
MFWPLVYFYLICRYIKIKIKGQNEFIAKAKVERKVLNGQKILKSILNLNAIYSELNEYNREFWCLYLLSVWLLFGVFIIFTSYFFFFWRIDYNFESFCCLYFSFTILTFLFIMSTASSVNYEANKIYKPLNQVMANYRLRRNNIQTRNELLNAYSRKIKVKINNL